MPLLIFLLIGVLAFGLFDLTLGRPLPVHTVLPSIPEVLPDPPEGADLPSIRAVAASQVAPCEAHDTACQLVALYGFVTATVTPQAGQRPWLHAPQHPARTLSMKTGDAADIAMLFSSLLDQQRIRNYVIVLTHESYVLACDIPPSALRQAGGRWQAASSAFDPRQISVANDPTAIHATEWIDAYSLNVIDAPCPCLLLDPSAPTTRQPGDSLPAPAEPFRSAIDLNGRHHGLIYSGS